MVGSYFLLDLVVYICDTLLLSKGQTVVKINAFVNKGADCECNQSRRRVVFYPEPVAMSTTFCKGVSICSLSTLSF